MKVGFMSASTILVPLLLAIAQVNASEALLRWKFSPGDELILTNDETRKVELLGNEPRIIGTYHNTTEYLWTVVEVHEDDSATIKQTIRRLQLKAEAPRGTVEYDSADPDTHQGQGAQVHATLGKLAGGNFTYRLAVNGVVSDVQPSEELKDRFSKSPPQLRELVSSKMLTFMIPEMKLPEKPLAPMGSWTANVTLPELPIGDRTCEAAYSLVGTQEVDGQNLIEIGINEKATFVPRPQQGATFNLKDVHRTGTALFDEESGRLVRKTLDEGFTIVVTAGATTTEQRSSSTTTATFKPVSSESVTDPQ